MKKTVLLLLCSFVWLPLTAQSTCETRVDSHQKATTRERVDYCLNEPVAPAEANGSELIYYGVTSGKIEEKEVTPSKNKNPYFEPKKVSVSGSYVGTDHFPAFKNDTLSEQELAALRAQQEQAYAAGYAAGQKAAQQQTQTPAPKTTKPAVISKAAEKVSTETKKGLAMRQTKPKRELRGTVKEEPVPTAPIAEADPLQTLDAPETNTQAQGNVPSNDPALDDLSYGVSPTDGAYPEPLPANNPYGPIN